MPADYAVLAPFYDTLGMAEFAETMTPRLIDFAQRSDWMGRRVLDLGCGTGSSLAWLIRHSYIAVGLDQSAEMLEHCRQRLSAAGLGADLRQGELQDVGDSLAGMDLVLALDVINELPSLREVEALLCGVHAVLAAGRLFMFDLHTIQGLNQQAQRRESVILNHADLFVMTSSDYDFDRQVLDYLYVIFHRDGDAWRRSEGTRMLRGYPVQAVAALLQRCGFLLRHVTDMDFEAFEPGISRAERVILVAEKQ